MFYFVTSVELNAGKRYEGIAHLKKFTTWAKEKYGISSEVVGNLAGKVYVHYLVMRFDNLSQWQDLQDKLMSDPEYHAWFKEGFALASMQEIKQAFYQVF
jgi:hypothetical protein